MNKINKPPFWQNKGALDISLSRTLMRGETRRLPFKFFIWRDAWWLECFYFPAYGSGQMSRKASAQRGRVRREKERDILRGKDRDSEKNPPPQKSPLFFHNSSLQNCSVWYEPHIAPLALIQPYTPFLARHTVALSLHHPPTFSGGPPYPVGTAFGQRRPPPSLQQTPSGSIESRAALSDVACFVWQADRSRANKQNEY